VTALDEKDNKPHVLGGFQFKGTKEDLERLLAPAKKQVRDSSPAGKADLISYQDHAIETFDSGPNGMLAATYLGDWYLISNDTALLKAAIDRVDHRTTDSQPPLSKEADFQAVGAKLPSGYETFVFGRAQPFLTRIYALAAASGRPLPPEKRAEADKIKAVGAVSGIENGKIRDTIYTLAPGLKQDSGHLQMSSLPLSSPETLFYLATAFQWPAKLDTSTASSVGAAAMEETIATLATRGITLDALRAAFGTEGGVQLDWPASSLQPSILVSLDVRDHDAAQKMVTQLTSAPLDELPWQTAQADGQTYYSLTVPNVSTLQPTLTLTAKHLIIGIDAAQVRGAAGREGTNVPTFTASEAYKSAFSLVDKPNVTFAYLDTKGMFERTYGLLRPYAIMGAAFFPPQYAEYIDMSKLPDTEIISKHLSPSVLSQTLDQDGAKLDSVGSLTFAQGAVGLGGVVSGVAYGVYNSGMLDSYLPSSRKAAPKLTPPTPAVTPVPAGTPAPKPDDAEGQ
jgi:hypothetical protein